MQLIFINPGKYLALFGINKPNGFEIFTCYANNTDKVAKI